MLWSVFLAAAAALVYNGPGACDDGCYAAAAAVAQRHGLTVRFVGPAETDPQLFDGVSVWLQPGGESRLVTAAMSDALKGRLKAYVEGGGAYVGFCAGGFFASAVIHTTDDSGQDQTYQGLGLFPGETFLHNHSNDAMILPLTWAGRLRYLYWEGGPYFAVDAAHPANVLATYANASPAAIELTYGSGRVALSGVHPEAPQDWRDAAGLTDPDGLDFDLADGMLARVLAPGAPPSTNAIDEP